jgi:hypothetical protein
VTRSLALALALPFGLAAAACTGDIAGSGGDGSGSALGPDASLATDPGQVTLARGMQWVAAQLEYCQAPNHATDHDSACPSTCERMDNPEWDPYRSDCSGFVSWAWELPPPGRTTKNFAPFQTDLTHVIAADELRPGDAVNNSEHVMLFEKWVTQGSEAMFLEETGCSSSTPYAVEIKASVTTDGNSIVVQYHGTYTAIRYDSAP